MYKKLLFILSLAVVIVCSCGKPEQIASEESIEQDSKTKENKKNTESISQPDDVKNISGIQAVRPQIAISDADEITAIQPDGSVICFNAENNDISPYPLEYENAVAVYSNSKGYGGSTFILQDNGEIVGKNNKFTEPLKNVADIAYIEQGCAIYSAIVLYKDGTVGFVEENDDKKKVNEELKTWTDIKQIYYPVYGIVLGVRSNGDVVVACDSEENNQYEELKVLENELKNWTNIKKIAFSTVAYFAETTQCYGLQFDGQIITNFPDNKKYAKYIKAINELTDIVDIASPGSLSICALKKDGSVIIISNQKNGEVVTETLWTDIRYIKGYELDGYSKHKSYQTGVLGMKSDGSIVIYMD